MRVSLSVTNFTWSPDPADLARRLGEVAEAADHSGLDTLWVNDHLLQADPGAAEHERDMLEVYTTLGWLAARTGRIRLGALVSPVTYREPALLLKAVASLDVLSGGRAWLGVGAGYPGEAERMGLPMPPTAERFDRLEELLELAERMRRGDTSPFAGRHHHLAAPEWRPLPLRPGGVPVLVGGMGPRHTLRLVARYGAACNLFDLPDGGATVRTRLEVLRAHCERLGRDPGEVDTTLSLRMLPAEEPAALAERMATAAGWGIRHAVVIRPGPWTPGSVAVLAETAERVRDL